MDEQKHETEPEQEKSGNIFLFRQNPSGAWEEMARCADFREAKEKAKKLIKTGTRRRIMKMMQDSTDY